MPLESRADVSTRHALRSGFAGSRPVKLDTGFLVWGDSLLSEALRSASLSLPRGHPRGVPALAHFSMRLGPHPQAPPLALLASSYGVKTAAILSVSFLLRPTSYLLISRMRAALFFDGEERRHARLQEGDEPAAGCCAEDDGR